MGNRVYEELKGKSVLITGATGLIGSMAAKKLLDNDCKVTAVVRDIKKARRILGDDPRISYIVSDITEFEARRMDVDHIIHAASNTSSRSFVNDPVGVIHTMLKGTENVLETAVMSNVKGFVYLSSMEVYGTPDNDGKIDETHGSDLNTMSVRSSYPESKRMCENLCASYFAQYSVPAKVVRLTQTIGPGVDYNDGRVFAEFARCVVEGRDIILHTKGETRRSYVHVVDAVDAIFTVLINGAAGEAYNAANEATYCSVYEMADMVARRFGNGKIRVIIKEDDIRAHGYVPTMHMNLDTGRIRSIGWNPSASLEEMFSDLIGDFEKRGREGA